jgi:hypothetical protein
MFDLKQKFNTEPTREDMLKQRLLNILKDSDDILTYTERRTKKLVEDIFEDDMFSAQDFADTMGEDAHKLIQALQVTNQFLKTLKPEMRDIELPSDKKITINKDGTVTIVDKILEEQE